MKKFLFAMSAIALLGLTTGCVDPVNNVDNPNFNRETNEVNTKFIFNVSTQATSTKQTPDAVQATSSNAFRGIGSGRLMTAELTTSGKIMTVDQNMSKYLSLTNAVTVADLTGTSRRVYEISLPLKTNVALFYGKAPQGTVPEAYSTAGYNADEYYGKLGSFEVLQTAGSTNITLGKRLVDANKAGFEAMENVLSCLMTTIMATNVSSQAGNHDSFAYGSFSFDGNNTAYSPQDAEPGYPEFYWSAYIAESNGQRISPLTGGAQTPLEEKLANVYYAMMSVRQSELRAGSGEAVLRTLTDLWSIVNEVRCASPTSYPEAMAKYFASIIHGRMLQYLEGTVPTDGKSVTDVSFKTTAVICAALSTDTYTASATLPKFWPEKGINGKPTDPAAWSTAIGTSKTLAQFPFCYNMPRGATHMKIYNRDADASQSITELKEVFYYPTNFDTSAMGGDPSEGGAYNAESYYYPAELIYFANSPLRTTDTELGASDYPGTAAKPWSVASSWETNGWETPGFVKASTRSVALQYEVNYGCAMLKTEVGYTTSTDDDKKILSDGSGNYIYDNNHAIQKIVKPSLADSDEPDKKIYITENSFRLTGIIIGGQYTAIDWDMLPKQNAKTGFIYDSCIPTDAQTMDSGNAAYTLVFDNYLEKAVAAGQAWPSIHDPATQETVYVALEFQNKTDKDFYGNANLIRKDGYFYLIGALNPASSATTITWPTNHIVPPYTSEGASQQVKRVFMQDFVTSAKFTLGQKSLQAAYLTVPDLRSSSLTLGLSVDTKWETGLNFPDVILGY